MHNKKVIEYYDTVAREYDSSRFGGSYGRYIDSQERRILKNWLSECADDSHIVEVACGTGRLSEWAYEGYDASETMLSIARKKFPEKLFIKAFADNLPLQDKSVDCIYCFHLLMHLERGYVAKILSEFSRVLAPGGVAIFDFPSRFRREIVKRPLSGWHGDSAFTVGEIKEIIPSVMKFADMRGIMMLPVHRLPHWVRGLLSHLDNFFCMTFFKHWASYTVVKFKKDIS